MWDNRCLLHKANGDYDMASSATCTAHAPGRRAAMSLTSARFTCGTVTGEFGHLMEGGEGDITVPIPVFLIEHPKGTALFDSGLHPDCQHDPAAGSASG